MNNSNSNAETEVPQSDAAEVSMSSQTIAKPHVGSSLSHMYRLMIYFAHSTMVMYSADIVCHDKMTVADFREQNKDICQRVFDEGLSIMNYELSYEQVSRACQVYLQTKYFPQSVKKSKVYTPS